MSKKKRCKVNNSRKSKKKQRNMAESRKKSVTEQRADKQTEMENLLNKVESEQRAFSDEESVLFTQLESDINNLNRTIDSIKKGRELAKEPTEEEKKEEKKDEEEPMEIDYGSDLANLLGEAACKNEFSPEQIRIIQDLVIKAVPVGSPLERCDYLIHQMHTLNYYASPV